MITLKEISKIYQINGKPFYALDKVDLNIKSGESVAIRGRSGAGKSTLLHIIGCLDTYSSGSYLLNGNDISSINFSKAATLRNEFFGFILQDFSLINHKTALYNVMSPMFFNKTPFFKMKQRALEALEAVGVAEQANKDVLHMSGGQRQRVAIARAIVNNPDVILADEPTGNLDSGTEEEIMTILKGLNQSGKTLIIVTHDDSVASYCDRTITINDGKIISDDIK